MEEVFFTCPTCWQEISVLADLTPGEHAFVEDCEVCCHPILIRCTVRGRAGSQLAVVRLEAEPAA